MANRQAVVPECTSQDPSRQRGERGGGGGGEVEEEERWKAAERVSPSKRCPVKPFLPGSGSGR
ncbi:hypothetical protein EYF80_011296 [Liparis tanakae]|uniref:Uncharacterized protein n=1 Tax=Liparis tanakae TaxID=230148 RepID=A0A4Z2IMY1_9TELE|nr:hypothetical protein EYF80_011296 [Liparis tanakae]